MVEKTHFSVFFQVFSRKKHLRYPSNSHFLRFWNLIFAPPYYPNFIKTNLENIKKSKVSVKGGRESTWNFWKIKVLCMLFCFKKQCNIYVKKMFSIKVRPCRHIQKNLKKNENWKLHAFFNAKLHIGFY